MPKYALDRNAVIEMEKVNAGEWSPMGAKLREIDKRKNFASCLLSVLETSRSASRDSAAVTESITREEAVMRTFFRKARTDSGYLLDNQHVLSGRFLESLTQNQAQDLQFIASAQQLLAKQTAGDVVRKEFKRVVEFVRDAGRMLQDPLSLVVLACPLGSERARGLLKPSTETDDEAAFNALADVEKIKLVNYIEALMREHGERSELRLFSEDRGLMGMKAAIVVTHSGTIRNSEQGHEVGYCFNPEKYLVAMPFLESRPKISGEVRATLFGHC